MLLYRFPQFLRRHVGTALFKSMGHSFVQGKIWNHPSPLKNDPNTTKIGGWGHLGARQTEGRYPRSLLSTLNTPEFIRNLSQKTLFLDFPEFSLAYRQKI